MTVDEGAPLSEREVEIVQLVATGATNLQIAQELVISVNTVKVHLRNIFAKLGAESRTEATLSAIRQGWVQVGGMVPATEPYTAREIPQAEAPALKPVSRTRRLSLVLALAVLGVLVLLPQIRSVSEDPLMWLTDQNVEVRQPGPRSSADRWTTKAQMPTPRSRFAQAVYGGRVWVIGGDTPAGPTGVVEAYDPVRDEWERGTAKPVSAANIGAVFIDDRLYIPGGYDAMRQITSTLEIFDLPSNSWTTGEPLPTPLCAYAIAAHDGSAYLFGGWDGTSFTRSAFRYDVRENVWYELSPLSSERGFAAAAVVDGLIYVIGGYNGKTELELCEVYDPDKEGTGESPWSRRASLVKPRGGLAVALVERSIYAIGGGLSETLSFNERYDISEDTWFPFETPFTMQWRTLGASVVDLPSGAMIYTIGGWNGDYLSANEQYRAIFRIHIPEVSD